MAFKVHNIQKRQKATIELGDSTAEPPELVLADMCKSPASFFRPAATSGLAPLFLQLAGSQ
jgi:hypothetical protein